MLFESGVIVLHIVGRRPGLLPTDEAARAEAISWMFAALNTVEPPIVERHYVKYFEAEKSWHAERFAMVDARTRTRLDQLTAALGGADWLADAFSAADILMVHAIPRLEGSGCRDAVRRLIPDGPDKTPARHSDCRDELIRRPRAQLQRQQPSVRFSARTGRRQSRSGAVSSLQGSRA